MQEHLYSIRSVEHLFQTHTVSPPGHEELQYVEIPEYSSSEVPLSALDAQPG